MRSFEGIIAATFTPMRADGTLDVAPIASVTDALVAQGVEGLFVCGSTGEFPSLSTQERKTVLEAYVEAADGRIPVVAHVGSNNVAEACELARHAAAIQADAMAAVPPHYFPLANPLDQVITCMQTIARQAPDLPLFYYHLPGITHVSLDIVLLLKRSLEAIPNLAGIKFSWPRLDEFRACCEVAPNRYSMFFGADEMYLAGLAMGAQGAVGSTYNFATPLYTAARKHYRQGDVVEAERWQARVVMLVHTALSYGGLVGLKAMMRIVGPDCGPPRLPLQPLSDQRLDALRQDVQQLGFFEWISEAARLV